MQGYERGLLALVALLIWFKAPRFGRARTVALALYLYLANLASRAFQDYPGFALDVLDIGFITIALMLIWSVFPRTGPALVISFTLVIYLEFLARALYTDPAGFWQRATVGVHGYQVGIIVFAVVWLAGQRYIRERTAFIAAIVLGGLAWRWFDTPNRQFLTELLVGGGLILLMATPALLVLLVLRIRNGTWSLDELARWKATRDRQAKGYDVPAHELGAVHEPLPHPALLYIAAWRDAALGRLRRLWPAGGIDEKTWRRVAQDRRAKGYDVPEDGQG